MCFFRFYVVLFRYLVLFGVVDFCIVMLCRVACCGFVYCVGMGCSGAKVCVVVFVVWWL